MKKAYMLVGVPAAGKSTWIDTKVDEEPFGILSSDDIIEEIATRYGMTYSEAFHDLIQFADRLYWKTLTTWAERGDNISLDRTHLDRKTRKRALDILNRNGYEVTGVVFPIPEPAEWQRRLDSRPGKNIPQHVLDSMVKRFEHPIVQEGFTSIEYAVVA